MLTWSPPRLLLFLALSSAIPGVAFSLAIQPIEDRRFIQIQDIPWESQPFERIEPSTPFVLFDEMLLDPGAGGAAQTSIILVSSMSGSGFSETDGCLCRQGTSRFDVSFRVDEAARYSLSGRLNAEFDNVAIELLEPDGVLFALATPPFLQTPFSDVGTLQPGVRYQLIVEGSHRVDEEQFDSYWQFDFGLTPIPEPDTAGYLLLGLLFLGARRPCTPDAVVSPIAMRKSARS